MSIGKIRVGACALAIHEWTYLTRFEQVRPDTTINIDTSLNQFNGS